jgi:hypothetical protein
LSFGERFLVYPELFPARLSGEPWGNERLDLVVAGIGHRFEGLSASQCQVVRERFAAFLGEGERPTRSRVFRVVREEFREFDTRGWDYDLDLDASERSLRIAGMRLLARLEWRPEVTGGLWTAATDEEFPGVFENYLRVLTAYRLAEEGGALVHSAGVVDRDEASLFVGVSGAGKSTLSGLSLAEGRKLLSDDLNALVPGVGRFHATAVPFAGDFRSGGAHKGPAVPVRSILRLRKGPEHALAPLRRSDALALLASCAPYVNRDPWRVERLLANLAGLLDSVETHELRFAQRPGLWELLSREVRA